MVRGGDKGICLRMFSYMPIFISKIQNQVVDCHINTALYKTTFTLDNCGIRHVTVPIATRILIANDTLVCLTFV